MTQFSLCMFFVCAREQQCESENVGKWGKKGIKRYGSIRLKLFLRHVQKGAKVRTNKKFFLLNFWMSVPINSLYKFSNNHIKGNLICLEESKDWHFERWGKVIFERISARLIRCKYFVILRNHLTCHMITYFKWLPCLTCVNTIHSITWTLT